MSAHEGFGGSPGGAFAGAGGHALEAQTRPGAGERLRIGIINIMPRAESYEPYLRRPLAGSAAPIELAWIRLESHVYSSSDREHIGRSYRTFDQTVAEGPLDGLVLTGAPVEELSYDAITYWPELSAILAFGRQTIRSTLGLCWGGMALAKQLGIEKRSFPRKVFGVFENRKLVPGGGLLGPGERFWCAQSRHSGIADGVLEDAREAGALVLLSHAPETGYTVFATPEHSFVMHLGHPEYEPSRLIEEWQRDARLGRTDVEPPRNFDLGAPVNTWRPHRAAFFSGWVRLLQREGARRTVEP